ncbi:MAG: DUF3617 family protein [Pseudomonadales bacterium]|nr:DUF3617 family protein [Pseudomonadales bacterium]
MDMRFLVTLTLLVPGFGMAAETILPGLYETTVNTEIKMGAMELPPNTARQTTCITAEDVANGPPVPQPGDADCDVQKYEFGNGKLNMEMVCSMQGGEGRMIGTGSYTNDSYEMNNLFKMKTQGMEMEMKSVAQGRRIKDC